MGGLLLHIIDFNQDAMARKILASKRQVDGGEIPVLEAPRNSLEMQVEITHNCFDPGDDGLQVEEDWSDSRCFPMEAAPVKRLINEEMSRNRKSSPSIVARLMGVEMLPLHNVSVVHQPVHRRCESIETTTTTLMRNEKIEISSANFFSSNLNSSRNDEQLDEWSNGYGSGKPMRREHPQEEELQKFKKEFEAWQAARFKECSRVAELVNIAGPLLAPKEFNKQRKVAEADSEVRQIKKSGESTSSHVQKASSRERSPIQHQDSKMELSRTTSRDIENHCIEYGERLQDKSSAQPRIVILKPGPDELYDHKEDSWTSSPATSEERGGMENFLQEVKERLTSELEGKAFKKWGSAVRGSGIETPFREMPSDDPRQIARHLAKHVRERVGMNLIRSESTRSSRSEMQQFNGYGSPEFMNRDTRRYLSERLKNVIRRKPTHWEITREKEPEMQTGSFRRRAEDDDDDVGICTELSSPKNLIRSLSAPVSGTSFGKLLLEDRHILTGAQIRRKHESLDSVTEVLKKQKKERFNIRQKVSSFRQNFTLRRMLFAKRFSSVESYNYGKDIHIVSPRQPTVMNFGERQITMMENSTEVPPSPASICSSTQDDFWSRPADCFSPISTPDVNQEEDDNGLPQAFKDICSNLKELRRQINRLGSSDDDDESELAPYVDCVVEPPEEIDDKAEAYIQDLLVASGLYNDSSSDICLSKPIPSSVFEQVEEEAAAPSKKSAGQDNEEIEECNLDRKMLYDLLNEALTGILHPGQRLMWVPCARRNVTGVRLPPLRGRKLHERVWKMISEYVYPTPPLGSHNQSSKCGAADDVVERHLGSMNSWSCRFIDEEELDEVGKEMQVLIVNELIEEAVEEMCRSF